MIEPKDAMVLNKMAEIGTKVDGVGASVKQVEDNVGNVATKTDIQSVSQNIKKVTQYNPKAHMKYNQYHVFNMNPVNEYGSILSTLVVDEQYLYIGASYNIYVYNKISGQFVASVNIASGDYSSVIFDNYQVYDDYIVFWSYRVYVLSKKDWTLKYNIPNSHTTSCAWLKEEYLYFVNNGYLYKYNLETAQYEGSISCGNNLSKNNSFLNNHTLVYIPSDSNIASKIFAYNLDTMEETTVTIPKMYAYGCFYTDDGRFITADARNIYVYDSDFKIVEYICLSHDTKESCDIYTIYRDKTYMYCKTTDILFIYQLNDLSLVGYYYYPKNSNAHFVCDGTYMYIYLYRTGTVSIDSIIHVESGGES